MIGPGRMFAALADSKTADGVTTVRTMRMLDTFAAYDARVAWHHMDRLGFHEHGQVARANMRAALQAAQRWKFKPQGMTVRDVREVGA